MPNPTAPHTLGPWHGGVDYSKPSEELTKNQLHDMNNTVIGKAGEAAKRLGCAEYNSSAANGTSTLTACGQQRFTAASIREFAISGDDFFEGPPVTLNPAKAPGLSRQVTITHGHW